MRSRATVHLPFVLALLVLVAPSPGCRSNDVRVEDAGRVALSGRVLWQLAQPTEAERRVVDFSGVTLTAEVSHVEGKDDDRVLAGAAVVYDQTSFATPGPASARGRVTDAKAMVRVGALFANRLRIEQILGLQLASADVAFSSAGLQATERSSAFGVLVGFRMGLQLHERVELYGRATTSALGGVSRRVDSAYAHQAEIAARILPIERVGLFAGYRWAEYWFYRDKEEAEIDFGVDGPIVGLELRF